jgi:hypothetical protein
LKSFNGAYFQWDVSSVMGWMASSAVYLVPNGDISEWTPRHPADQMPTCVDVFEQKRAVLELRRMRLVEYLGVR